VKARNKIFRAFQFLCNTLAVFGVLLYESRKAQHIFEVTIMKKAFVLFLAAALIITAFAGCNSNSIKQKLSGKEPESMASDAEGSSNELLGGWIQAETPVITDEFMKIFNKATETLTGVEYTPVAYIASQVVAGRNHCVLCRAKATVPDAKEAYVILCIYEDLQGNATITDIYENSESADSVFFDGSWTHTETPVLPDGLADNLHKVYHEKAMSGAGWHLIALIATKEGDGIEYLILCQEKWVTVNPIWYYCLLTFYVDTDGNGHIKRSILFDRDNADNSVEIANPVAGYQTLEEAEKAVGFDISVPADIKELINFSVIGGSLLEIDFKGGYMRKAKGTDDISGDYNAYTDTQKLIVGNITYTLKGDGKTVSLAVWTDGGYTYCLHFDEGAAQGDMLKYISEIE